MLFPIAVSDLDLDYMDNGANLADFIKRVKQAQADPTRTPGHIHIIGYASPDGPYKLNQRLAQERPDILARYIKANAGIADSLMTVQNAGIDWQGLDRAVANSSLRNAHRVQYIIRHEPEFTYNSKGRLIRSRKQQLQNLEGGRTWNWMMENLYPALRTSASVFCYIEQVPAAEVAPEEVPAQEVQPTETRTVSEAPEAPAQPVIAEDPEAPAPAEIVADDYIRYPIFALRSNLLLPLMNVGIEIPVAEHWTVGADYYYPWVWPKKSNKNCFELAFVSAEARYWFRPYKYSPVAGRNFMLGHSLAVYGAWGYYDFERNWHGHQGQGWSAGIDYTFAMPIAKGRLHLEFEIAVGALRSPKAQPYTVYENGGHLIKDLATKNFFYLGPTKVGVSLVLPINRKVKQSAAPAL